MNRYDIMFFIIGFLLGSAPLITHNFSHGAETIGLLWNNLWRPTSFGYNNFSFIQNIKARWVDFGEILSSQIVKDTIVTLPNDFKTIFSWGLFFIVILYLFFVKKAELSKNKIVFFL